MVTCDAILGNCRPAGDEPAPITVLVERTMKSHKYRRRTTARRIRILIDFDMLRVMRNSIGSCAEHVQT
ncbi:hypothetical protein [Methanopyrus sp.]